MKERVIPCDSSAQAILFSLFQREGVKYREQAFRSGPYAWTQMPACLLLVPEEEYDHAAEILKNFLEHCGGIQANATMWQGYVVTLVQEDGARPR